MNKREIARQFSLDTVIYDPELSTKAAKALSADMIEVSPEQCFDMDVVFDRHPLFFTDEANKLFL